ncbi:hypothetical protein RZO55_10365 [Clostridium boliviensis]|uniref:Uncharacterized protein n=1 Tax=Clostridium boliviensis TaxID=318465 RepID=A0ABU4GK43_9CLOT|nr:hypothetical protein [Clostridium boliviensis]MDW2797978.1 hypothetical protein [Clostridium boliviensis]
MSILIYLLIGLICASSIVVFIFITLSSLTIVNSRNKEQEDQEQIQWINDYGNKLGEKGT